MPTAKQLAAWRASVPSAHAGWMAKAERKQANLRAILLAGRSLKDAAALSGYTYGRTRVLRARWRRDDPVFKRRLEERL